MLRGFVSYSHEDDKLCRAFRKQLYTLELAGIASFWADYGIQPGDPWKDAILSNLECADVALFLVSPDMFWSKFVREIEWPIAKRKMEDGKLLVIPVILRPTAMWERIFEGGLGRLQAVPNSAKPVVEHRKRDTAYADSARLIANRIEGRPAHV